MLQLRSHRTISARPLRAGLIAATVGALALGAATMAVPAVAATTDPAPAAPVAAALGSAVTTPIHVIDDNARDALAAARTALDSATTVGADVTATGLDIGASPAIDTESLRAAVDALDTDDFEISPVLFLPSLTEDVLAETEVVADKTDDVATRLAAAKKAEAERIAREAAAKKAAEEAAAKKAAEEAAAAAAAEAEAAAEAQQNSGGSGGGYAPAPSGGGSGDNSVAGAQATARDMASGRGWGDGEFQCLVSLWNRESGWNYQAYNSGSGAFGIPQALPGDKMASAGSDWQSNAATQIAWGLSYIADRYGSPCGGWSHSESVGWY